MCNISAVAERLVSLQYAYNTLIADGDLTTPIHVKAIKYLLNRDENPMCEVSYIMAVQNKVFELESHQGEIDLQKWLNSYVMLLPADPFEALTYDRVLEKIFVNNHIAH